MERFYRAPSNYSVDAQHRIEQRPVRDQADILLDAHFRGAFPLADKRLAPSSPQNRLDLYTVVIAAVKRKKLTKFG
jgi:hypothetical protein